MDPAINRLVLKANRSLGSQLSQSGLVSGAHLDEANEIFVSRLREGPLRDAGLLRVLLFDLRILEENALLSYQFEQYKIGGGRIDSYQVQDEVLATVSLEECMATWTVPVDHWHGTTFLFSCYYMSDFVRQFWEERVHGPVSWLATTYTQLDEFFEQREAA
ncbi:MAG: hypothetical protein ACLFU2_10520, partial [Opitutales bacterium]